VNIIRTAVKGIDWFVDRSGQVLGWLILAFVLTMAYEVIARYVFNAPTVWSYDISYMLGGGMIILGGAYLILHEGHVRIDIFYGRLSTRQQLVLDIVLWLLCFLPMVAIMARFSFHYAYRAWKFGEVSGVGIWRPPLFPFKATLFVAWCLVVIEGICWFIRDVVRLIKGREM